MKVYLYILLVSLFLLNSCGTQNNKSSGATTQAEVSQETDNNNTTTDFLKEYKKLNKKYSQTESFQTCMSTNLNYCYEKSIEKTASLGNDVLICDDIKDEQARKQCKDTILSITARENKDINWCDKIEWTEKINCRFSIVSLQALDESDPDICDTIISEVEEEEENIKQLYKESIVSCKSSIYTNLAIQNLDSSLCEKIWDESEEKNCIDQIEQYKEVQKDNLKSEQSQSINQKLLEGIKKTQ